MKRIIYLCEPTHGHIDYGGVLELLSFLNKKYKVSVYSGSLLKKSIRKSNLQFFDIGLTNIKPSNMALNVVDNIFYHIENYFFSDNVIKAIARTCKRINQEGCDLIISDPYCHVAPVVSQVNSIPFISVVSPPRNVSRDFLQRLYPIITSFKKKIYAQYGISELYLNKFYPVTHASPSCRINFSIKEFNITKKCDSVYLGGEKIESVQYIKRDGIHVYYSSGTLFWHPQQIELILNLAKNNPDIHFHISIAKGLFTFNKLPNVIIYDFVDQKKLFPDMDLIITQGGMGTVNEAIRAGIPILDIPVFFGNYAQGEEIQAFGNGIFLRTLDEQKELLEKSFIELLENNFYRERAKKLQQMFHNVYDVHKILAVLKKKENLVSRK